MLKTMLDFLKPIIMPHINSGKYECLLFIRHNGEVIELKVINEQDFDLIIETLEDGTLVKYQSTIFFEQPNEQQS